MKKARLRELIKERKGNIIEAINELKKEGTDKEIQKKVKETIKKIKDKAKEVK
jgi:pyrroline-5-carboxylate reductase